MNYFLKMRFTHWAIIVLLLILIAILGTFLYFKLNNKEQSRPISKHERFGEMLRRELNLTNEQAQKFKEFRVEYQKMTRPVFDSIAKKRIEMVNELSKTKPDTIVLYRLSDDIGKLHARLKRETVNNILKMKNICTPEQLIKFNTLNKKLIGPEGPMHRRGNNQNDDSRHDRN